MHELTLPLALFNLLPVLFTALALFFLARLVGDVDPFNQRLAWAGAALILLGGLSKATWKLVLVTTAVDLTWLAGALFPLMAPGFALLAGAVAGVFLQVRGWRRTAWVGYGVGGVVLLVLALVVVRTLAMEIPRGWFLPLLALVSVANLVLSLLLIATALRLRRRLMAVLFAVNLMMVFALPPIAMMGPDSLFLHWLEQILTAVGTAAFALGAYWLWTAAQRALPGAPDQS